MNLEGRKIWGYRRENGRVGVRNHVAILPLDDISNAACEAVAAHIQGTIALPHAYGRLQFGEDLDLHFRTMIGTGANPNVAACIVIGIESGWTEKVVAGIAKTIVTGVARPKKYRSAMPAIMAKHISPCRRTPVRASNCCARNSHASPDATTPRTEHSARVAGTSTHSSASPNICNKRTRI